MFLLFVSLPYSPTPTIKWFKRGGDLPARKVKFENFNKTMKIISVSEEDAGEYVCMATNQLGSIRHSISVQVKGEKVTVAPFFIQICNFVSVCESIIYLPDFLCHTAAPYWLDKPTNLVLAPDENGRLVCRANGNPKPNIQWLINGQPVESKWG